MFLRVIGNSRRRQKILSSALFFFITVGLIILGYFTIKHNSFSKIDTYELAQEISSNATENGMSNGSSNIDFEKVLWDADLELVKTEKTVEEEPKKDILLIVSTFIGVDGDVHEKYSWYTTIFSLIGSLIYYWTLLQFSLWADQKVEAFLDDSNDYARLGDENEFKDFVLDLRRQRADKAKVEIKSTESTEYDVKSHWGHICNSSIKQFQPIAPAFLYAAVFGLSLYLVSCYHTWMREPNEVSENMRVISNFVIGLESSILLGKRDVNSFVFVILGILCQSLFFLTVFRVPDAFIGIYCALIGKELSVKPAFLNSITEEDKIKEDVNNNHEKHD